MKKIAKDVPAVNLRALAIATVQNAVDRAMAGSPEDMEWLASTDAQMYYDVLDLHPEKVASGFLRNYLAIRNEVKRKTAWSQRKQQLERETHYASAH